jgi:flavin-dependent dehydrogenase
VLSPNGRYGMEVTLSRIAGCDEPSLVRLDRVRFDELLVRNAVLQGAAFRPLHTVTEVRLDPEGSGAEVVVATPHGPADMRCKQLIDATGKQALLASQLGMRRPSGKLDPRVAVFTHFRPDESERFTEPDTMTVIPINDGYIFVIPLEPGRVSVGVIVGEQAAARYDGDLTMLFWTELDEISVLVELMSGAEQLLPIIPALNTELIAERFAGPGYLLAGDAAAFTDPFFSTGIDFGLRTGVLAGRAVARALAAPDAAARREAETGYEEEVRALLSTETTDFEYARLSQGQPGRTLSVLADPHLPTLLPLLGLLQAVGGGTRDAAEHRALVRGLRDDFDRPLSAKES